jgi:Flp pilus assembly protein TadB
MECPNCKGLNSLDTLYGYVGFQKFCTSCGASIKEPSEKESREEESPEQDPFDLSTWGGRVKLAGALVVLAAFLIIAVGIFWNAISSWGWIWGIVAGIIFILLLILFRSVP